MKDEHDKSTIDLVDASQVDGPAALAAGRPADGGKLGKPKRLPRQSAFRPPSGSRPEDPANTVGNMRSVVPVSAVARDWGISARRVRKMLEEGRLQGRQLENGYWEVTYPYCYIFGTRGPQIKRQRDLPESTYSKSRKYNDSLGDRCLLGRLDGED